MSGNEPQYRSMIASLETALVCIDASYLDRFGTLHCTQPGLPRKGQAAYGDLSRRAYRCGCQPAIHRFRCACCRRTVGWCCGAHGECEALNACCDTCVVLMWESAARVGVSEDALGHELDHDDPFRKECFARVRRVVVAVREEVAHGA